jgi:hypothetical protein
MKTLCPPSGFTKTAVKEETNLYQTDSLSSSFSAKKPQLKWAMSDDVVDEMLAVLREDEALCHE